MEWLSKLSKAGGTLAEFETRVQENVGEFVNFMEKEDDLAVLGTGNLPRSVLKTLINDRELDTDLVAWLVNDINLNSKNAFALSYSEHIFEGQLRETFLKQLSSVKKPALNKLIAFLNVGRSTFDERPM